MVRAANPRTPFVVCVRYAWRKEPVVTYPTVSRKRLCDALDVAWAETVAWLKLVGGQATPLDWLVIDARDNAEYRRGIAYRFGEVNGTDETGRPYARWGGGTLEC